MHKIVMIILYVSSNICFGCFQMVHLITHNIHVIMFWLRNNCSCGPKLDTKYLQSLSADDKSPLVRKELNKNMKT